MHKNNSNDAWSINISLPSQTFDNLGNVLHANWAASNVNLEISQDAVEINKKALINIIIDDTLNTKISLCLQIFDKLEYVLHTWETTTNWILAIVQETVQVIRHARLSFSCSAVATPNWDIGDRRYVNGLREIATVIWLFSGWK